VVQLLTHSNKNKPVLTHSNQGAAQTPFAHFPRPNTISMSVRALSDAQQKQNRMGAVCANKSIGAGHAGQFFEQFACHSPMHSGKIRAAFSL
jgi:hypothetical protein